MSNTKIQQVLDRSHCSRPDGCDCDYHVAIKELEYLQQVETERDGLQDKLAEAREDLNLLNELPGLRAERDMWKHAHDSMVGTAAKSMVECYQLRTALTRKIHEGSTLWEECSRLRAKVEALESGQHEA